MMFDLHNNVKASRGISPAAAVTNNTAFVSQIIDNANYTTLEFIGIFGAIVQANATFTVLVEHADNEAFNVGNETVHASYLEGVTAMGLTKATAENKTFKIGYKGPKRYVRVTITPASNDGNIFLAGIWLQGNPRVAPQSTQIN